MSRMERVKKKKENKILAYFKGLTLRERVLLFISLFIFIFLIANFTIIKPLRMKEINLAYEVNSLNAQKVEALASNETNTKLINEYTIAENKYNSLIKRYENKGIQDSIVKSLIQSASINNVNIKNITFQKGQTNSKYKDIINNSGAIVIEGSYNNILNFIKSIQENNNGVVIAGVNIGQNNLNSNNVEGNEYAGTININYYNVAKGSDKNE